MSAKRVYTAIAAVSAELAKSGIAKAHVNETDGYQFRGIDDIYNALAPLLARNKLCILPRILERCLTERRGDRGELVQCVALRVAFDFVSAADGSCHTVEIWGEGIDASDKATNKAMSAAYKYAAVQVFCIPITGSDDADRTTHGRHGADTPWMPPVQGWQQWVNDITDLVEGCQSEEALARLQQTYRVELRELSRAESWMFRRVGSLISERKRQLEEALRCEHPTRAPEPGDPPPSEGRGHNGAAPAANGQRLSRPEVSKRTNGDASAPVAAR